MTSESTRVPQGLTLTMEDLERMIMRNAEIIHGEIKCFSVVTTLLNEEPSCWTAYVTRMRGGRREYLIRATDKNVWGAVFALLVKSGKMIADMRYRGQIRMSGAGSGEA